MGIAGTHLIESMRDEPLCTEHQLGIDRVQSRPFAFAYEQTTPTQEARTQHGLRFYDSRIFDKQLPYHLRVRAPIYASRELTNSGFDSSRGFGRRVVADLWLGPCTLHNEVIATRIRSSRIISRLGLTFARKLKRFGLL
jgi:hypothetical protein